MQDGIIRETGNSRLLRTIAGALQQYPTYESFIQAMVKGEFPIDWAGKNPDGWVQSGTELNKANLLTDATAALLDLPNTATPNDMLAALANLAKAAKSNAEAAKKMITYGTSPLIDGVSDLATGTIYIQYE